ncbi:hypothetical protein BEL07_13020 [Mycolicibacterium grossiae]|uniref:Uncharacterized protein n=1 Tax=Mycolicibacterium grossiae TaxID=1552759 RepID=A0A1E8Q551_9MYCO|nr:hypothetical protein BEL07_13020 [Mycolicibacterium grossiae]
MLRSRIFGSIAVAGAEGVTLHRGILRIVSDHLLGRNPMAATDGERIFVEFALESAARDNAVVVRRFAEGVAGLMGADAVVEKAQVMQFDTSDIDHLLLPEHRSE